MTAKNNDENIAVIGTWRRKSQQLVYENNWISLTHDEVVTPAGTDGVYGLVHFKNRALAIVPLDNENNTWLVGQFRYALNQYSWEVPMGGGALDAQPLAAAQRELKEETGLYGGKWQQLFKLHTSNSITDEEGYAFLATHLLQGDQALDASEADLTVKKVPFTEAVNMIFSGEITDTISIAALLAVDRMQRL